MKYRTWKSFFSKSLLVPFILIALLCGNIIIEKIEFFQSFNINYFFSGGIVGYGVVLIIQYLASKGKYKYLVIYGLIYCLIGVINLFIDSLYSNYFTQIYLALFIIHGVFKIVIRNSYNKIIRFTELGLGVLYILFSGLIIMDVNKMILLILLIGLLLIESFIVFYRIYNDRKFIKEEIKEQEIENKATIKKEEYVRSQEMNKKTNKKIDKEQVEIIDLERFFKK